MAKRKTTPRPDNLIGNALANEHDRGCVLVGAAYLEYRLEELLLARFVATPEIDRELMKMAIGGPDETQALLYNGWAKAVVLHLFGVIDQEWFKIFNAIRKLRNEFAHKAGEVCLDDKALEKLVLALGSSRMVRINLAVKAEATEGVVTMWKDIAPNQKFSAPRIKFMSACLLLNTYLIERCSEIDGSADEMRKIVGRYQSSSDTDGPSSEK